MQKGEKERRGSKEARPGRVRHSARIHGPENGWGARGSERERERGERERERASGRAAAGRVAREEGRGESVWKKKKKKRRRTRGRTERERAGSSSDTIPGSTRAGTSVLSGANYDRANLRLPSEARDFERSTVTNPTLFFSSPRPRQSSTWILRRRIELNAILSRSRGAKFFDERRTTLIRGKISPDTFFLRLVLLPSPGEI